MKIQSLQAFCDSKLVHAQALQNPRHMTRLFEATIELAELKKANA